MTNRPIVLLEFSLVVRRLDQQSVLVNLRCDGLGRAYEYARELLGTHRDVCSMSIWDGDVCIERIDKEDTVCIQDKEQAGTPEAGQPAST